jgi:membrane dipeptidase
MKVIDLHCDTILKIKESGSKQKLNENEYCVDIKKLQKGGFLAQFFALFVDMKITNDALNYCLDMLNTFKNEIENSKIDIKHVRNSSEMRECEKEGKIAAFLTIEEGGVLKGSFDNLITFYNEGVRLITLTWNYPNEIGFPNYKWKDSNKGLTNFGKRLIEEMNNLRMIIDVSHLSDGGFYDVAAISKMPFMASHSNARSITNHPRNLTDEMIKKLSEKGGVIGLNFCSAFLGNKPIAAIEDIVKHAVHIYKIGGSEVLSLGSDFDGIENEVEINNSSEILNLIDHFQKAGFSEINIEKIMYRNAERFIKDTLG